MTEAVRLAYAQGFMDKCAEAGLDAEKAAQDTLRDAAGGALSGGAVGGAAVGGAHAYDALIRNDLGLSDNAASVAHWFANKLPGLTKNMSRDDQLMLKLWKATRAIKGRPKAVIGGLAALGALGHMATGGGRGTKAAQFSLGADSNRNSALGTAAGGALSGAAVGGTNTYPRPWFESKLPSLTKNTSMDDWLMLKLRKAMRIIKARRRPYALSHMATGGVKFKGELARPR